MAARKSKSSKKSKPAKKDTRSQSIKKGTINKGARKQLKALEKQGL